jgi:HAAS
MTPETQMTDYLARLRAALTGMTVSEREDIVEEIQMHIRERLSDPHSSLDAVLVGLGPADELAQQYRTGLLVQRAQSSISPVVILRAALRWATTGVEGFIVFVIALTGYATGISFLLLALMKPFFPANTGLWVGPDQFNFSFRMGATMKNPASPVHEVLGWWLVPVCLVIGSLSLVLTTKLIQFLFRRFRWNVPFTAATQIRPAIMAL